MSDPCVGLACGENEWCGEQAGRWGCYCYRDSEPIQVAGYGKESFLNPSSQSPFPLRLKVWNSLDDLQGKRPLLDYVCRECLGSVSCWQKWDSRFATVWLEPKSQGQGAGHRVILGKELTMKMSLGFNSGSGTSSPCVS